MLTPQPVGDAGYLQVRLHVTGTTYKAEYLHRLVCLAFHGPAPEGKPLALHRDGNYLNNRSHNLYWGNNRDNYDDAVRHGTARNSVLPGERNGNSGFTDAERMEIVAMREAGYTLQQIADNKGVSKFCIWHICRKYA
jgi:HNH endonuclease